jgi:hypothetical protein
MARSFPEGSATQTCPADPAWAPKPDRGPLPGAPAGPAAWVWPCPASTPGGRKRSAAFGTLSAVSFWSVMIWTLAVMPGRRLRSGVRGRDDHIVRDDILQNEGSLPHLHHLPREGPTRDRAYGEGDGLGHPDTLYVGLINAGVHLHFREVLGNQEQSRGLETRGDGPPHIQVAGDHDSIGR